MYDERICLNPSVWYGSLLQTGEQEGKWILMVYGRYFDDGVFTTKIGGLGENSNSIVGIYP